MSTQQLSSALAAAALRLSRTMPGVPLAGIHGADLALKFSIAEVKFEREELALERDRANHPN